MPYFPECGGCGPIGRGLHALLVIRGLVSRGSQGLGRGISCPLAGRQVLPEWRMAAWAPAAGESPCADGVSPLRLEGPFVARLGQGRPSACMFSHIWTKHAGRKLSEIVTSSYSRGRLLIWRAPPHTDPQGCASSSFPHHVAPARFLLG